MSASAAPAVATSAEAPPRKRKSKLMFIIVGIVFTAAGAAFPMVVDVPALLAKNKSEKAKSKTDVKTAIVPFSDVVVNLSEEKMTRYLRLKIAVTVDADHEKDVTQELTKHKAAIKSKIISHVAGKTLKDVSGSVGVTRLQRELLEKFEDELYPDGNSPIRAVLFEEYVIQ
jgi:flagellar basal body-associated protein FliL